MCQNKAHVLKKYLIAIFYKTYHVADVSKMIHKITTDDNIS